MWAFYKNLSAAGDNPNKERIESELCFIRDKVLNILSAEERSHFSSGPLKSQFNATYSTSSDNSRDITTESSKPMYYENSFNQRELTDCMSCTDRCLDKILTDINHAIDNGCDDTVIVKLIDTFNKARISYQKLMKVVTCNLSRSKRQNDNDSTGSIIQDKFDILTRKSNSLVFFKKSLNENLTTYVLSQKIIQRKVQSKSDTNFSIFSALLSRIVQSYSQLDFSIMNKFELSELHLYAQDITLQPILALYQKQNPNIKSIASLVKSSILYRNAISYTIKSIDIDAMFQENLFDQIDEQLIEDYIVNWLRSNKISRDDYQLKSDSLRKLVNVGSKYDKVTSLLKNLTVKSLNRLNFYISLTLHYNFASLDMTKLDELLKNIHQVLSKPVYEKIDVEIIVGSNLAYIGTYFQHILHLVSGIKPVYVITESSLALTGHPMTSDDGFVMTDYPTNDKLDRPVASVVVTR